LNRVEVADDTMAFQFEKPPGFEFRPGQSSDLTLVNPPKPTPKEMSGRSRSPVHRLRIGWCSPLACVKQPLNGR
jgi:ferredoxin-NADP reductase